MQNGFAVLGLERWHFFTSSARSASAATGVATEGLVSSSDDVVVALVVCEEFKDVELEGVVVGADALAAMEVADGSLADVLLADPPPVDVLIAETSPVDSVIVVGTLVGDAVLAGRLSVDMLLALEESVRGANASLVVSSRVYFSVKQGIILETDSCRLNLAFAAPATASRQNTDFKLNPMRSFMPFYP